MVRKVGTQVNRPELSRPQLAQAEHTGRVLVPKTHGMAESSLKGRVTQKPKFPAVQKIELASRKIRGRRG